MRQMTNLFTLLAVLFFALSSTAQLAPPSPAHVTLVKAGRLLDPRTGNVLSPAAVLIENGKIKEVNSLAQIQGKAPAGLETIDLGSATLLPGLIDSHTHLLLDVMVPAEAEINRRYNGEFVPGLLLAITMAPSQRVLLGRTVSTRRFGEWLHDGAQSRPLRHRWRRFVAGRHQRGTRPWPENSRRRP